MEKEDDFKLRECVLLIIVIILLILCIITSFRTGQRFFEIGHSDFGNSQSNISSDIAKFCFDARIVIKNDKERIMIDERNNN